MSDDDETVGYKRPPKNHQFKAGQSGNPSGRPKKVKTGFELFNEELNKKVEITENGRRKRYTKERLLYRQMANLAVKGDLRAMGLAVSLKQKFDEHMRAKGETGLSRKERAELDQVLFATLSAAFEGVESSEPRLEQDDG